MKCPDCARVRSVFCRTLVAKIEIEQLVDQLREEIRKLQEQCEEQLKVTRKSQKNVGYLVLRNAHLQEQVCALNSENVKLKLASDYCMVEDEEEVKHTLSQLRKQISNIALEQSTIKRRLSLPSPSNEQLRKSGKAIQLGIDFLIGEHSCQPKECLGGHRQEFEEWIRTLTQSKNSGVLQKLKILKEALRRHLPDT